MTRVRLKAVVSLRLYGLMDRHAGKVFPQILASRFVRDLQESFGRGRFVAIVHSPNERYVLVHGDAYDPECPRATLRPSGRVPNVKGITQ